MARNIKPGGNRAEPNWAQSDRMAKLHQAMEPYRKSVAGYKKLRELMPAYLPMRIGKTLKDCAVSVGVLTDEKPAVLLALIKKINGAAKAGKKKPSIRTKAESGKAGINRSVQASIASTKRLADSMTVDQINKATPYKLHRLKDGDYAVKLGAIQYMRFEGVIWARYYCEILNIGYRNMLRDIKESKAK